MPSRMHRSLRETFPIRASEWALATILLNWSIILAANPDLFADRASYANLARFASQETWALLCLLAGVGRLLVLLINGAWRRTPHLRAIGAFVSCFFWFGITLGFAQNDLWSTGMAVYPVFLLLDGYNIFKAITDAAIIDNIYASGARGGTDQ
jgi:hypothetical protein